MRISKAFNLLLLFIFLINIHDEISACSMYKVTADGKTMVGCNEDAWRTKSKIWFINAKDKSEYGVAFTGSRRVKPNQFAPQSGMNEVGLAYSRLASYFPERDVESTDKISIKNEVDYLTDILQKCGSVDEVKQYIERYDHSLFVEDVFIYIDSSGKYLIVEPYELIVGNDSNYVLSNFCPSITDNVKARKLERYRNGEDYLKNHEANTTLPFCTALSDTMHVCRNRNGDGTLLTTIWDTNSKLVNLYFYHDYSSTVQFNIIEELAKGDHMLDVISLFPKNSEFERLVEYATPFNTPSLRLLLVMVGGVLTLLSFIFTTLIFINRKSENSNRALVFTSILNLLLTVYFAVLVTNMYVFYFDAPYVHYNSNFISISSYIPFLLLLSIVPMVIYAIRFFKNKERRRWVRSLVVLNNLIYIASFFGFIYWGLFDVL